jgi:hypothetical protein
MMSNEEESFLSATVKEIVVEVKMLQRFQWVQTGIGIMVVIFGSLFCASIMNQFSEAKVSKLETATVQVQVQDLIKSADKDQQAIEKLGADRDKLNARIDQL